MAPTMPADLACTALQMAIATRKPKPGLMVHTDRCSQYASKQHQRLLAKHGAIASMSRKGNFRDNAAMERFAKVHAECPFRMGWELHRRGRTFEKISFRFTVPGSVRGGSRTGRRKVCWRRKRNRPVKPVSHGLYFERLYEPRFWSRFLVRYKYRPGYSK